MRVAVCWVAFPGGWIVLLLNFLPRTLPVRSAATATITCFANAWSAPAARRRTRAARARRLPKNEKFWTHGVVASPAMEASSSSAETTRRRDPPAPPPALRPQLPLPDPIRSDVPGTWAHDTMSRRVNEEILERTWLDNRDAWEANNNGGGERRWGSDVRRNFQSLRSELAEAGETRLTYLEDHEIIAENEGTEERSIERQEWRSLLEPYVEHHDTWLSAPWMVTEFYVYRRLMAAIGYFDPRSPGYGYDPFEKQKRAGLVSSVGSAEPILERLSQLGTGVGADENGLPLAASVALWGNKMDLSLWPASADGASHDVFTSILHQAGENLLHDDTPALVGHCQRLRQRGGGAVDIVVDNAGFELVTDLALAAYLVGTGIANTVTFQLKSHPTFVSDALEKDLRETVAYYRSLDASLYPRAKAAGDAWQELLDSGAWVCHEHRFWAQPFAMWDMTEPLRTDLSNRCDLAIIKGDANYRRLLGDRKWSYSADFQKVVGAYFPCPVVALRTLKAELGCGMSEAQVRRARTLDSNWLVNGRFGVIQFGTGTSAAAMDP